MQLSSYRPAMRSGASAVAYAQKSAQTQQPAKNNEIVNAAQLVEKQQQTQNPFLGKNFDFSV